MKKIFKVSLLLLAAVMFFAGCQKETPEPEKDKIELSDGIWHLDSVGDMTMYYGEIEENKHTITHIEMEISGDDVTILEAILTTTYGTEHDFTEQYKTIFTSKKVAEDFTQLSVPSSGNGVPTAQIDNTKLNIESTVEKNEDGTEYHITTKSSYCIADVYNQEYIDFMESVGYSTTKPVTTSSDIIYKKISD